MHQTQKIEFSHCTLSGGLKNDDEKSGNILVALHEDFVSGFMRKRNLMAHALK